MTWSWAINKFTLLSFCCLYLCQGGLKISGIHFEVINGKRLFTKQCLDVRLYGNCGEKSERLGGHQWNKYGLTESPSWDFLNIKHVTNKTYSVVKNRLSRISYLSINLIQYYLYSVVKMDLGEKGKLLVLLSYFSFDRSHGLIFELSV